MHLLLIVIAINIDIRMEISHVVPSLVGGGDRFKGRFSSSPHSKSPPYLECDRIDISKSKSLMIKRVPSVYRIHYGNTKILKIAFKT